jgi:hypothetical protein
MSEATVSNKLESPVAGDAARREFKWSATTRRGAVSIVRTGQSSPIFIQANN